MGFKRWVDRLTSDFARTSDYKRKLDMNKILFFLVSAAHLLPHPFGVSPVGAAAIYAGAYVSPKRMWLYPIIPLLIADVFGGFYDLTVMAFVYAGFALSTVGVASCSPGNAIFDATVSR